MPTPSKSTIGLALLALLGWGAFWAASKRTLPTPEVREKIVYQEKVVYKDRIVHKDQVRTETRPDGTKIVTETKSASETHVDETTKRRHVEVNTSTAQTHYSLGLAVKLDVFNPIRRDYEITAGQRLFGSPFWGTFSYSTRNEISLGVVYTW